jgi:hypothetical protein
MPELKLGVLEGEDQQKITVDLPAWCIRNFSPMRRSWLAKTISRLLATKLIPRTPARSGLLAALDPHFAESRQSCVQARSRSSPPPFSARPIVLASLLAGNPADLQVRFCRLARLYVGSSAPDNGDHANQRTRHPISRRLSPTNLSSEERTSIPSCNTASISARV